MPPETLRDVYRAVVYDVWDDDAYRTVRAAEAADLRAFAGDDEEGARMDREH